MSSNFESESNRPPNSLESWMIQFRRPNCISLLGGVLKSPNLNCMTSFMNAQLGTFGWAWLRQRVWRCQPSRCCHSSKIDSSKLLEDKIPQRHCNLNSRIWCSGTFTVNTTMWWTPTIADLNTLVRKKTALMGFDQ